MSAALAMLDASTPVHPMLAEVTRHLEQGRVRWALLRPPRGGLSAPSGDVDVVVHPADLPVAVSRLASIGFVRLPRAGRDVHLLRYADASDEWLWLHTTSCVALGDRHQIGADGPDGWMAGCRVADAVPRLGADLEFWALLWHCLADKGAVATHHRETLRQAAAGASATGTPARVFSAAVADAGLADRCLRLVAISDWHALDQVAADWTRAIGRAERPPMVRRLARAANRRLDALRHLRQRRGLTVAVLGPDGAGKSTLVDGLARTLPLQTRTRYMGLTGGALRHARRLRLPGLVFAASALIIWSRYARAWMDMRRGRVVLFDRYVYDAAAPPAYEPGRFERLGRQLSGHLCPAPDLVLLLDAPGRTMYLRKGEYDPERLEHWRQCFLSLTRRGAGVQVIDASRPTEVVRADATGRIWRQYAVRVNALATSPSETRP